MRSQTTPHFSPDGLGGNGVAAVRDARSSGRPFQSSPIQPRAETARDRNVESDQFDDGLVHGHFWAMSSTVR